MKSQMASTEFAKWAVGWDEANDATYAAALREDVKFARIKREKQQLLDRAVVNANS